MCLGFIGNVGPLTGIGTLTGGGLRLIGNVGPLTGGGTFIGSATLMRPGPFTGTGLGAGITVGDTFIGIFL